MAEWRFGNYIGSLLTEKRWTNTDLAEASKLSDNYIGWIVRGEASGKKGPPSISVDSLISLSRALNVSEAKLLAAYKGKDPDSEPQDQESISNSITAFIQSLPAPFVARAIASKIDAKTMSLALLQVDGVEKVMEIFEDAKRELKERKKP